MHIFLFVFAFLVLTDPTLAAEDVFGNEVATETGPEAVMDEFANMKPGLLMSPEDDENKNSKDGLNADPNGLAIYDGITEKIMTLEEIKREYLQGNYAQILPSLTLLTNNGHHGAEEIFGIMYKNGQGVEKNLKKSFDYLSKAAEANYPTAQHHLGIMYYTGEGLDVPDAVKALMWLEIAIVYYQSGEEKDRAKKDRDNLQLRLSRRDKDRATEMTRAWLNRKGEGHLLDLQ